SDQEPRAVPADVPRVDQPPGKILGARGERVGLATALEKCAEMEGAVRAMVRWRKTQRLGELPRPSSRRTDPKQSRDPVGRRAGRQTRADVPEIAPGRLSLRERAQAKQDSQRRSRYHL